MCAPACSQYPSGNDPLPPDVRQFERTIMGNGIAGRQGKKGRPIAAKIKLARMNVTEFR